MIQLHKMKSVMSFIYFSSLPGELRLLIWNMSFSYVDPAVATWQPQEASSTVKVALPHGGKNLPSVALASYEAYREWVLRTSHHGTSTSPASHRLFVPRLILLADARCFLDFEATKFGNELAHIALDVTNVGDIVPVFEALASMPQLKTIILIVPCGDLSDEELGAWQSEIHIDQDFLKGTSTLIDHQYEDRDEQRFGELLRSGLSDAYAKRYYGRQDSPLIKLRVRPPSRPNQDTRRADEPWGFMLYD